MNILRYMLIRAYFEANRLDDEDEAGLDYDVPAEFKSKLINEINKEIHKNDFNVDATDGTYIQCDPGYLPPIGAVFDGIEKEGDEFYELQIMVETDKFCNINNLYWEKV